MIYTTLREGMAGAVYALLFVVGMEFAIVGLERMDEGLSLASRPLYMAFAIGALLTIMLLRSAQAKRDFLWAVVLLLHIFCASGLLLFIDSSVARHGIVVGAASILFLAIYGYQRFRKKDKEFGVRSILYVAHFSSMFFFFTLIYAFHVNVSIPQWLLMLAYFFIPFLVSTHSFVLTAPRFPRIALRYGIILGLMFAQLAWFIHYWPFGYLTTGAVMLVTFYVLWDLLQSHLEQSLRLERFFADMALLIALSTIVLLSSPWQIVG